MDTAQRQQDVTTEAKEAATDAAPRPIQVFRIDDVAVAIFARQREAQGRLKTFYDTSFSRSYKDETGRYRYSRSFGAGHLETLVALAVQAHNYIRSLQTDERPPVPVTVVAKPSRKAK